MPITDKTTISLTMRPKAFSEVIGLREAVTTIKALIDAGGVPRAILLKGPFGCGKTTLAYIIAKYIQGPLFDDEPCVEEINAANHRKIDDIRGIIQSSGSYPMRGTYKVVIMDECHQMLDAAQQVLLKELEVPKSPTVWILCTTDPSAINEGIRSRCTILEVKPMNAEERLDLIMRAARELQHEGDFTPFVNEVAKQKVGSPRKILQAFSLWHFGTPLAEAVGSQCVENLPEYSDIAFAVLFGRWASSVQMFSGSVTVKPVGQLLKELDERLKKKPAPNSESAEKEDTIESDDLDNKSTVAIALKTIVAAFLKGQIIPSMQKSNTFKYKQKSQIIKAAKAMTVLANNIPADQYSIQWPGLIATLFEVNQIMQSGE